MQHVILHKVIIDRETKQPMEVDEEYIICDVCGHANPVTRHECEKCSNFLEDKE